MEFTIETCAWIGSVLLALCALPEAIHSYKKGKNESSWIFLLTWFFGEIFTLVYVISKVDWPLILNYGLNIMFIAVILKYKWRPVER